MELCTAALSTTVDCSVPVRAACMRPARSNLWAQRGEAYYRMHGLPFACVFRLYTAPTAPASVRATKYRSCAFSVSGRRLTGRRRIVVSPRAGRVAHGCICGSLVCVHARPMHVVSPVVVTMTCPKLYLFVTSQLEKHLFFANELAKQDRQASGRPAVQCVQSRSRRPVEQCHTALG